MTKLPPGYKKVVVKLPNPNFASFETMRERGPRLQIQRDIFNAFKDKENVFRQIVAYFYGEETVNAIHWLMTVEGFDSEDAEALMLMIVSDYAMKTPPLMFLHYLAADNFEKAKESFFFYPMHIRYLNLVTIADGRPLRLKCPETTEEFDYLCEEMGLRHRANGKAAVLDSFIPDLVKVPSPADCKKIAEEKQKQISENHEHDHKE